MELAFVATKQNKRIEVLLEDNLLSVSKDEILPSIQARRKYERLKKEYKKRNFEIEVIVSTEQRKRLKREKKKMLDIARLKANAEKLRREIVMGKKIRLSEEGSSG